MPESLIMSYHSIVGVFFLLFLTKKIIRIDQRIWINILYDDEIHGESGIQGIQSGSCIRMFLIGHLATLRWYAASFCKILEVWWDVLYGFHDSRKHTIRPQAIEEEYFLAVTCCNELFFFIQANCGKISNVTPITQTHNILTSHNQTYKNPLKPIKKGLLLWVPLPARNIWKIIMETLLDDFLDIDAIIGGIIFYGFADHILHSVTETAPFCGHCWRKNKSLVAPGS
jgi:hypothetical protein